MLDAITTRDWSQSSKSQVSWLVVAPQGGGRRKKWRLIVGVGSIDGVL